MAVRFKTLALTTCCPSPLRACPGGGVVLCVATDCLRSLTTAPFGACDKVASDLGLHLQLASHELATIWQQRLKKKYKLPGHLMLRYIFS